MGVTLHEIGGFAVRPEFQRKGLGRALREYTESKAMRADTKAFFTALEYNVSGIHAATLCRETN